MNGIAAMAVGSGLFVGLALMVAVIAMTLNMAQQNVKDAALKITLALPNGAATSTPTAGIDTQKGTSGQQVGVEEWLLTAPACTTTELADTQTITYSIKHSDNADLSSSALLFGGSEIIQTGAGGAGDVLKTKRFRLPSDAKRYIFFITVKAGASNASTKSGTLEVLA